MQPRSNSKSSRKAINRRWIALCVSALIPAGVGCRQRAYTELYVENMAGEIRMLEDRVYEYDSAYQELEAELEAKSRLNESLERKLRELKASNEAPLGTTRRTPSSSSSLLTEPEPLQLSPKKPSSDRSSELPSVLVPEPSQKQNAEPEPIVPRMPAAPPPLRESVVPAKPSIGTSGDTELLPPVNGNGSKLEIPAEPRAQNRTRPKRDTTPSKDEAFFEQVELPQSMVRSAQQPKIHTPPAHTNAAPVPRESVKPGPPSLMPPTIQNLPTHNPQGAVDRKQIRLPEGSKVQFASATEPVLHPTPESSPPKITDNKVVEVGFHPTLCRGHNFDDQPGDDGLYLVVNPLNAGGQVLNQTGKLTVVVEDEGIQENNGRVVAREFTAKELEEHLVLAGSDQGFHVSLPWEGVKPISSAVTAYLRLELEDGRSLVNKRTIQLRKSTRGQSAWTPRK